MIRTVVIQKIIDCGVLPVIRAESADEAQAAIEAVYAGGISVIEVTMTLPDAAALIAELSAKYGEQMLIGAGTVMNPESAHECIEAGAKFIVSPALNFDTVAYCNERQIIVMPGALTPTEVVNAWEAGADIVKVFPAGAVGGPNYLRSLKAPLPQIKLIPTGGVSLDTAAAFIKAGAEAIGVGADLVDLEAIREGKPDLITEIARQYLEIVAAARK